MATMSLGVLKERKVPIDRRVPFSPAQCVKLEKMFPHVKVKVESSDVRAFTDQEYKDAGVNVVNDLSDCDIIMGVKEPSIPHLFDNKTYCVFSHTIKKQPFNRKLMQAFVQKKIRLVDYEMLRTAAGAFSRFAGIVGTYNGLKTYGERYHLFSLKPAHKCKDLAELKVELQKSIGKLTPIRILVIGKGRVGGGATEIMKMAGFKEVDEAAFLSGKSMDKPVYLQVDCDSYVKHRDGKKFVFDHYFAHPSEYLPNCTRFLPVTDLLVMTPFWDRSAPLLFTVEEAQSKDFKVKVIADITCDIPGSIPTTIRSTSVDDPVYDMDLKTMKEAKAYQSDLSVMVVDNLPCELPRDAAEAFGELLIETVMPHLLKKSYPKGEIVDQATMTFDGRLNDQFKYLQGYVDGKE